MARKQEKQTREGGRLRRAADAVKRLFARGEREAEAAELQPSAPAPARTARKRQSAAAARPTRRVADIPLDVIGNTYTPPATSSKASFRSDGSDHQDDQEFALGSSDERWNDEDRFTNKSGDPRIGTHRRTYEPAEAGIESRK